MPTFLRDTTLGDVLGGLHRLGVSGELKLTELSGLGPGHCHVIVFREGRVTQVLDGDLRGTTAQLSSGTQLSAGPPARPSEVREALDVLARLGDARLSFHSWVQRRSSVESLEARDFLHGRPRRRDRVGTVSSRTIPADRDPVRARALHVLGLGGDATRERITERFRRLAASLHPDRAEGNCDDTQRFAEISSAYHTLVA